MGSTTIAATTAAMMKTMRTNDYRSGDEDGDSHDSDRSATGKTLVNMYGWRLSY